MSQFCVQNYLYIVLEKGVDGNQVIIVGVVYECFNVKLDFLAVIIEKFCELQVVIVFLMIIEKGYCIDLVIGVFDISNLWIIYDL